MFCLHELVKTHEELQSTKNSSQVDHAKLETKNKQMQEELDYLRRKERSCLACLSCKSPKHLGSCCSKSSDGVDFPSGVHWFVQDAAKPCSKGHVCNNSHSVEIFPSLNTAVVSTEAT